MILAWPKADINTDTSISAALLSLTICSQIFNSLICMHIVIKDFCVFIDSKLVLFIELTKSLIW